MCSSMRTGKTTFSRLALATGLAVARFGALDAAADVTPINQYVVVAQLNLWYYGPGCFGGFEAFNCSGQRNVLLTPYLGFTYRSVDPDVLHQQIEWAAEYGVDAFSLEWTTPRGVGGSLEPNIDDAFLKAPNLYKVKWAIFYDLVLRLLQTGFNIDGGINFDDPAITNVFVSDFDHFAQKYFGQPQHLAIDGRPVVYIWATWTTRGNVAAAVQAARAQAATRGYDVFIVGDEIRTDRPFDAAHASLWDATTTFTFLVPGIGYPPPYANVAQAATGTDAIFQQWRDNTSGLQVAGRTDLLNFQPGWAPQYDDRLFRAVNDISNPTYVPAESKDQVVAMAEVARKHAEPVGSGAQKLVWENTFNGWAETTTIEPTANLGPKYPAGNYQFDMLEVVREVFGAETYSSCGQTPAAGCRTPTAAKKAKLMLHDNTPDAGDRLTWKWASGAATSLSALGDPPTRTTYTLCLYDASASQQPILQIPLAPGGSCASGRCWKASGTTGFTYSDKLLTADGIAKIALKSGAAGKAKITVVGKGTNLSVPPLPLVPTVTVQLQNDLGECWQARYSLPTKNDAGSFVAASDP